MNDLLLPDMALALLQAPAPMVSIVLRDGTELGRLLEGRHPGLTIMRMAPSVDYAMVGLFAHHIVSGPEGAETVATATVVTRESAASCTLSSIGVTSMAPDFGGFVDQCRSLLA